MYKEKFCPKLLCRLCLEYIFFNVYHIMRAFIRISFFSPLSHSTSFVSFASQLCVVIVKLRQLEQSVFHGFNVHLSVFPTLISCLNILSFLSLLSLVCRQKTFDKRLSQQNKRTSKFNRTLCMCTDIKIGEKI